MVDVLSAPLCSQLIAITHSPFVFDNELEPFARALRLRRGPVEPCHEEEVEADLGDAQELPLQGGTRGEMV